ncbi:MAG: hypothetical protein H6831_10350 [Planctomycetes bacterium]|nr:hypothetical protein [Planctomycetota bacterium]MCB9904796.1 hypothetical protein [Planctomycetota bacterium]
MRGAREPAAEEPAQPAEGFDPRTLQPLEEFEPPATPSQSSSSRKGGLAGRVKRGIVSMAAATYDARADDLQVRAVAAMREALQEESERIIGVAIDSYDRRADDLEERAVRAIRKVLEEETERFREVAQSTYDARADDIEDRAVRALRRAMVEETRRIRSTIERSVQAKRREVRLSLTVLVLANLLYLLVYWVTQGFD